MHNNSITIGTIFLYIVLLYFLLYFIMVYIYNGIIIMPTTTTRDLNYYT